MFINPSLILGMKSFNKCIYFFVYLQVERRVFTNFHRQVFCWTDKWYGLTMEDIRKLEAKTKTELDEVSLRGWRTQIHEFYKKIK